MPTRFFAKVGDLLRESYGKDAQLIEVHITNLKSTMQNVHYVILPPDLSVTSTLQELSFSEYNQRYRDYSGINVIASPIEDILCALSAENNRNLDKIDFLNEDVIQSYCAGNLPRCLSEHAPDPSDMLRTLKPSCFSELTQVYGLLHSAPAWDDTVPLHERIAFREDIYDVITAAATHLSASCTGFAQRVMRDVRAGRYQIKGMPAEIEANLHELGISTAYIDAMKRTRYLFPRGHCLSYMRTYLLMQWFHLHYPDMLERIAAHHWPAE